MPSFVQRPVRVRVPATSANLGPGFDSAGLCLALHDEVEVAVAPRGQLRLDVRGEGAETLGRQGRRHLVVTSLSRALDVMGAPAPGLTVRCTNRIPQSRGLGSSSAAIVAGVLAARALVEGGEQLLDDDALLRLADDLEGHPDNVAACLRGGFTLAWTGADGVHVVRRDVVDDLLPVVLVPTHRSSTKEVRGLLPAQVPHADAAANAACAGLLALAVTSDPSLLLAATQDRLHQPYRAPAMPATAALVDRLRAQGVPAVVSGAGPTVLALTTRATADAVLADAPGDWQAWTVPVDPTGAVVLPDA